MTPAGSHAGTRWAISAAMFGRTRLPGSTSCALKLLPQT